jgi:xylose isomerase
MWKKVKKERYKKWKKKMPREMCVLKCSNDSLSALLARQSHSRELQRGEKEKISSQLKIFRKSTNN